ncbi:MAG: signal peptidase I [Pseudomonadota bacterium]
MNWEIAGWIAIAVSMTVIVVSFFAGGESVGTSSGQKNAAANTELLYTPSALYAMLEIAWPVLFIASLAMLTFKEVMGFAAVLLTATVLTGAVWLIDALYFRKQRIAVAGNPARDPVLVEMAKSFFPVILIVFLLRSFLYEPFKIPTGSMVPSLLVGDFILVNKFTYGIRIPVINKKVFDVNVPKRSDVMVFRYPEDTSKDFIKRVIGIPGDVISYKNKRLMVNGQSIETIPAGTYTEIEGNLQFFETFREKLGDKPHQMMVDPRYPSLNLANVREFPNKSNCIYNDEGMTCKVPAGHYLMMGDSRDNSDDGRYWGFVPEANIVGKAVLVWMNFGSMKRVGTSID